MMMTDPVTISGYDENVPTDADEAAARSSFKKG
jgi:hypothetical protein